MHKAAHMKRRQLLGSVALGSIGATAGCINLAGGGGDDGETTTVDPSAAGPENYDLQLCSENDDAVYQVSNPGFERQDEEDQVVITFTLDYVGPNEDAFSVTPTINVLLFDENGSQVGTLNKAETFSPSSTQELEYFYSDSGWDQAVSFGFDIIHQGNEDAGCLRDEDADDASS